jgi:cell division protein FtsI (penicillin-binding protein 3)
MTIAFGHGISVSALQVAAAASAVMNGGVYVRPTLIKQEEGVTIHGTRVISAKTSDSMRKLLRLVVTNGTARKAEVPGYLIGGKTGTAEKIGARGGYRKNANITSFVSGFPIHNPRYMVMAMLDEPKGLKETYNFATAGWNAAPTGGKIIARIGPLLGVEPYDANAPEVKAALAVDLAGTGPRAVKPNPMVTPAAAPLVPTTPGTTAVRSPQATARPAPLPLAPVGGSNVAAR